MWGLGPGRGGGGGGGGGGVVIGSRAGGQSGEPRLKTHVITATSYSYTQYVLRAAADYYWEFFLCGRFNADLPYTVRGTNYRFDQAFQVLSRGARWRRPRERESVEREERAARQNSPHPTCHQFDLSELISRPAQDFGNRAELFNGVPTLDALCRQGRAREVVVRQVVARDADGNPVYDSVTQPGSSRGGGGNSGNSGNGGNGIFSSIYATDVPAPGLQPQPLPPVASLSSFRPYLAARLPIYGPTNAELGLGAASISSSLPGSGFAGSQRVAFRPRQSSYFVGNP